MIFGGGWLGKLKLNWSSSMRCSTGQDHLVAFQARGRCSLGTGDAVEQRLWNTWTEKGIGEKIGSRDLRTLNAGEYPLMSRTHKRDPQLGPTRRTSPTWCQSNWRMWTLGYTVRRSRSRRWSGSRLPKSSLLDQ